MSHLCFQGESRVPDSGFRQPHALIVPHTPPVLNLSVTILAPTRTLDGFLRYRDRVKLRVEVDRFDSTFKEVVVVGPEIDVSESYLSDPSRLLLYGTACCRSCAATQASNNARRLCDPVAFLLSSHIKDPITVVMSFDDLNTRFSGIATFEIPPRHRRPSDGQSFRCDHESLIISFALRDCLGNDVATFQVETPLKARGHQSGQLPQPVQPSYLALPQASPDFGSTETIVPLPQIVDVIPQFGRHFATQRVWFKVQDLPRGNGLHYFIGFGEAGIVSTSFVCSEGDEVQILECEAPVTSMPYSTIPSLMQGDNPQIPIGSSNVQYAFY